MNDHRKVWQSYRDHWSKLGLAWAVWVADRELGRNVPAVWPHDNVKGKP